MARLQGSRNASALVRRLAATMRERGGAVSEARALLLEALARSPLSGPIARQARILERLHDLALFFAAYPDDERVHSAAEAVLSGIPRRVTPAIARRLEGTGMAGTSFTYAFDHPIASWIGSHFGKPATSGVHPAPLEAGIAWDELEDEMPLLRLLPQVAGPAEDLGIDDPDVGVREWVDAARGRRPDLAWLTGALLDLPVPMRSRDALYDGLGLPLRIKLRDTRYSRTGARLVGAPLGYHPANLRRRADLRKEVFRPLAGRATTLGEARMLIDLARAALVSRQREMFPISHASERDVTSYEADAGLAVIVYGTRSERRLPLESLWGFLLVKNGLPIGYGCFSVLFGSAEVAMNIFESFRAGESAVTYASLLRVIHAHAGATSFTALKYQIGGDENEEAIESGAFWFYHKLGFRPFDPAARKVLRREEERIASRPGYRSPARVLRKLAEHNIYLCLATPTRALLGHVPYGRLGMRVTRLLAARAAGALGQPARRRAMVAAVRQEVEVLLGGKISDHEWTGEICLFVYLIKDVKSWSRADRRKLLAIIESKAGPSERSFCCAMSAHHRLKKAILTLCSR